jgi:hypothetical protein
MSNDIILHPDSLPVHSSLVDYLDALDKDPHWETQLTVISELLSMVNKAMWSLGYILVFLRFRTEYDPRETFSWDGETIPDELHDFIEDAYKVRLDQGHRENFLLWHSIRFDDFWILFDKDQIRIWEKVTTPLTEAQFDDHISLIQRELYSQLGNNTLYTYYRVGRLFSPREQYPEFSWTWYYEVSNLAANELESGALASDEDWQKLRQKSHEVAARLIASNTKSVAAVRGLITDRNNEKLGFVWALPPLPTLNVSMNGDTITGLEFVGTPTTEKAIVAILHKMGLTKRYEKLPQLYLNGDNIELEDGEIVARCPDPYAIENAFMFMAAKLQLIVRK